MTASDEHEDDRRTEVREDPGASHARASRQAARGSDEDAMAETLRAPGESGTHLARGTLLEGTYRVEALLGKGAMGAVYLVEHVGLQTKFAAKVVAGSGMDAAGMARLRNEARMASGIDHENIVRVTHLGHTENGNVFVVMERLHGEDLRARTLRHRADAAADGGDPWLPDEDVRGIVGPVLSALDAAHTAGVVHRDLKPENIFLHERQGRIVPKIVDFGIGKASSSDDSDVRLTATGQIVGTPLYMAPEQTRSSTLVDHRADIYAMGVMLFELLTGRLPFEAGGVYEIVVKHVTEAPPDPRSLRPDLPDAVSALVLRCLAKAPEDRFASAADLLAAWQDAWGLGADVPSLPATGLARRSEPEIEDLPEVERDSGTRARTPTPAPAPARDSLADTAAPMPDVPAELAAPEPRRPPWVLVAIGVAALAAVGAFFVMGRDPEPVVDSTPRPAPAQPTEVSVEAAPDPVVEPEPLEAPSPEPAAAQTRRIESSPPGAEVVRDGVVLGTTPLEVELPSEGTLRLELRRRGRETVEREVGPSDPDPVEVTLPPRRRPSDLRFPGLAPQ
ncbi:MAG: protein kinase [Sandaracinaceae bacterium]|nr:protein kinase [Sandaracinaceae bacterium]